MQHKAAAFYWHQKNFYYSVVPFFFFLKKKKVSCFFPFRENSITRCIWTVLQRSSAFICLLFYHTLTTHTYQLHSYHDFALLSSWKCSQWTADWKLVSHVTVCKLNTDKWVVCLLLIVFGLIKILKPLFWPFWGAFFNARWSLNRQKWYESLKAKASSTSSSTSLWAGSSVMKWEAKWGTRRQSLPSFSTNTSTVG